MLEAAYRRYGRIKVSAWVTMVCFASICGSGVFFLTEFILRPAISELPSTAAGHEITEVIFPWILGFAGLAIILAGLLLQFVLIQPLMLRRKELEISLANAAPAQKLEILSRHLDSALEDNLALRSQRKALKEQLELDRERQIALVRSSFERVLLLDQAGVALAGSAAMANAIGVRSSDISGKHSKDLLRLYDASKERPMEYPLRTLVQDTIARASSIPVMQEVLLVSNSGKEKRQMISIESVVAASGKLCGALLRLESLTEDTDSAESATSSTGQTDVTTGLPMRDQFDRRLGELISIARSQKTEHTLFLIAVDNLQKVYDELGYWAGEELLWNVAQNIKTELGAAPELYRITAMHFALLVPFESPSDCERTAERLLLQIDGRDFAWQEKSYRSSLSIALSSVNQDTPGNAALLASADADLRLARELGGNRVQLHSTDELLAETQVIENKLLSWLDDEGEQSHLQLQSQTLAANGMDKPLIYAILKVEMDDGFWIDPVAFLSSAENSDLQHRIDSWLVSRSLEAAKKIPEIMTDFGQIIVPISAQSMTDGEFTEGLRGIIAGAGLEPNRLILALDESACRSRMSRIDAFLRAMRPLDVGFALANCGVAAIQDLIPLVQPQLVLLHPRLVRKAGDADGQLQLDYLDSAARHFDFRLAVEKAPDSGQAEILRKSGVHFIAKPMMGLGPLY